MAARTLEWPPLRSTAMAELVMSTAAILFSLILQSVSSLGRFIVIAALYGAVAVLMAVVWRTWQAGHEATATSPVNDLAEACARIAAERNLAPRDVYKRQELTRGALGAFRRPALPAVADVLRGARLVAVLEDITNHTNVGAIFRSAAALGVDAVLASPACYDPLYRRAVRVSMGTVFQVPWTRIEMCIRDSLQRDLLVEVVVLVGAVGQARAGAWVHLKSGSCSKYSLSLIHI